MQNQIPHPPIGSKFTHLTEWRGRGYDNVAKRVELEVVQIREHQPRVEVSGPWVELKIVGDNSSMRYNFHITEFRKRCHQPA